MTRALMATASLLALILFGAPAASASLADCPTVVPADSLEDLVGEEGIEGYTVSQGTALDSFQVDILGVQKNSFLPGDQMIIARGSGSAIEAAGGAIASGMSGSPIYTSSGELIGALAYGFSYGPNDIMGITPAYQMLGSGKSSMSPLRLNPSLQKKTGARSLSPIRSVLSTSAPLSGPLGQKLTHRLERQGVLLRQGSGSLQQEFSPGRVFSSGKRLRAGDTVVADVAVGRTSFGGLGTTTYVCKNRFLGFGHPFLSDHTARAVVSRGEVLTYINDGVTAPYKYGYGTDVVGTMNIDNPYSIGGNLASATPAIDLHLSLRDQRSGKRFRGIATQIARQGLQGGGDTEMTVSSYIPALALSAEILKLTGRGNYSTGSARGSWTLSGTHRGKGFRVRHQDAWSGYESGDGFWTGNGAVADELSGWLYRIFRYSAENRGENISLRKISIDLNLYPRTNYWRITGIKWRSSRGPWKGGKKIVGVKPGGRFSVRVGFKNSNGKRMNRVLSFRRKDSSPGNISISRPAAPTFPYGPQSFQDLLRTLRSSKRSVLSVRSKGASRLAGSLNLGLISKGSASLQIAPAPRKPR